MQTAANVKISLKKWFGLKHHQDEPLWTRPFILRTTKGQLYKIKVGTFQWVRKSQSNDFLT